MKLKIVSFLALFGAVGAAQAVNIQFDGFCDGITGLTTTSTSGTGTWTNLDCAGTNAPLGGPLGSAKVDPGASAIMGSNGLYSVFGTDYVWVINKNGTWVVLFAVDGTPINSGTFSVVAADSAPKTKGVKSSISAAK